MSKLDALKKSRNQVIAAVGTGLAVASTSANAALADGVKNAINGGFSDANEAAGLMVIGFAGIFAVLLVMRLIKR